MKFVDDVGVHFNPCILITLCWYLFWLNPTFLSLLVVYTVCKVFFISLHRSGRIPSKRMRVWPSSSLWTRAGNYLNPSSDPFLATSSLSFGLQRYVACVRSDLVWEVINVMWKGDQQGDLEFEASVNNLACSHVFLRGQQRLSFLSTSWEIFLVSCCFQTGLCLIFWTLLLRLPLGWKDLSSISSP